MCLIVLTSKQIAESAVRRLNDAAKKLAEAQVEVLHATSDVEILLSQIENEKNKESLEKFKKAVTVSIFDEFLELEKD